MLKRMLIILLILMLFIAGCQAPVESVKEITVQQPTEQTKPLEVVYIGGVENGECLVPTVNLWDGPGGISKGSKVIDSVDGCVGLPVEVIKTQNIPPRVWYHVQTYGANKGKSGWVSETLIINN